MQQYKTTMFTISNIPSFSAIWWEYQEWYRIAASAGLSNSVKVTSLTGQWCMLTPYEPHSYLFIECYYKKQPGEARMFHATSHSYSQTRQQGSFD